MCLDPLLSANFCFIRQCISTHVQSLVPGHCTFFSATYLTRVPTTYLEFHLRFFDIIRITFTTQIFADYRLMEIPFLIEAWRGLNLSSITTHEYKCSIYIQHIQYLKEIHWYKSMYTFQNTCVVDHTVFLRFCSYGKNIRFMQSLDFA